MAGRSLSPDEAGLWARVMVTVRPLRAVAPVSAVPASGVALQVAKPKAAAVPVRAKPVPMKSSVSANTLDGSWDREIGKGRLVPDRSIDLHGHTLASAHAVLDHGLERAIAQGDRVLLLVTGKPPRPESERPHARGAIRAAVSDWLAASRHAGSIAAVRNAHPRHGGAGALYIVLRRPRR